jgi:N-acetylmuramoyl-L-alanine amidase
MSSAVLAAEGVTIPVVSHRARRSAFRRYGILCVTILLLTVTLPGASDDKRIAIYSVVANYNLPVLEQNGHDYVGLFEILDPLGKVTTQTTGVQWKLRYNDVDCQFVSGSRGARIQNHGVDLPGNFLLENGRGLVPLASLGTLLPQILGGPVTLHENSRRLYIGSAAVHFTAQISDNNPPTLVMNFTSPVNPRIATEPGKVQMLFTREPLVTPSSTNLTFDSRVIPSATYQESNGAAEIVVNTRVPLFASFSDNGRTITLSSSSVAQTKTPEPSVHAAAAPPSSPPETATPTAPAEPQQPSAAGTPAAVFAVVDASHGGNETGSMLSDQLAEKDITLEVARRLRQLLVARGLPTLTVRDADVTMSLDQRAEIVNQAHPRIYICIHASSLGKGTRVYTGWLPPPNGENSGPFLNWDTAQAGFLSLSQTTAAGVVQELQNEHITARLLAAPIRPLNNIATVAIAVEIAPNGDVASLQSADYQTSVANGIAVSLANMRARLEGGQ